MKKEFKKKKCSKGPFESSIFLDDNFSGIHIFHSSCGSVLLLIKENCPF